MKKHTIKFFINIILFFKLPLQIILAAYASFVLIAITIAVANHHGVDQHIMGAKYETRRNPV